MASTRLDVQDLRTWPASGVALDQGGQRDFEARVRREAGDQVDVDQWSCFTFALGLGRRAEALLAPIVERFALDGSQFSVLHVLWLSGPPYRLSPTRLSALVSQSPSGITHTVHRLAAADLVSRPASEDDGRAKHVQLTDKGCEVVSACTAEVNVRLTDVFATVDDVAGLAASLRALIAAFA